MKKYTDLIRECQMKVAEILPWDLADKLASDSPPLLLDIREPYEFEAMHIAGSLNVPRGVLESACEYDYEETVPELVSAREREIIVICRSGYRSVLAACTMKELGYVNPVSLKTGLRGWNEYEQRLVNTDGEAVDIDAADDYFTPTLRPDQLSTKPR